MRTYGALLSLILSLWLGSQAPLWGEPEDYWVTWTSPDGAAVFRVGPSTQKLYRQSGAAWPEVPLSSLAKGSRRHEYAGPVYFRTAKPLWIEHKFLILEHQQQQRPDALEIVDVLHSQQILSNIFESLAQHPTRPLWVALQLRAVGRSEEHLAPSYQDDLLLIDPAAVSQAALQAKPDAEPMAHLRSCELEGIALAPARWSHDGRHIICAVWREGSVKLVTYDGGTLEKLSTQEVSLKVDTQEATNIAWNDSKLVAQIEQLISEFDAQK